MLRSLIISPDLEMAQRLESTLSTNGEVSIGRILNGYPNVVEVVRSLTAHSPEAVFLSFESVERAQQVVKFLEIEAPGLQIVAIHRNCDAGLLRETMRVGVREFLQYPFDRQSVMDAVKQLKSSLESHPAVHESTSNICCFLPSKAGVGTSTLALNVSAAIARRLDMHVLLCDFDLNSGMIRFMLKLQNEYSVMDAVEQSLSLDEGVWPQLVTSLGKLDVLHAGRINPNIRVDTSQIRSLVDFTRRNYQTLSFDLSGSLEPFSLEIMQESKRIFLVCTPEVPSLHQAREKLRFLRELDLENRVTVLLNRCQAKQLLTKEQVEEILGRPVAKVFPNDYQSVIKAMDDGTYIEQKSGLGKSIEQFAQELMEPRVAPVKGEKHADKAGSIQREIPWGGTPCLTPLHESRS